MESRTMDDGRWTAGNPFDPQEVTSVLTPVARTSLADEVTKKLRAGILTGSIKPGERIREQEISEAMKTSRGPVRDALLRLEHEGLVSREPNHSAMVVEWTADDVEEVHSLRLCLELLALRYVIERAGEEDFQRLDAAADGLREGLAKGVSLQEAVDLDLGLHEEFVKAARHQRVLNLWQSIKPQVWFLIFSRNAEAIKNFQDAIGTHADLLEALRRRDFEKGRAIIQEHLDFAYINMLANFRERSAAKSSAQ
jgi:DNA-binding GntR family transcriptional regulator